MAQDHEQQIHAARMPVNLQLGHLRPHPYAETREGFTPLETVAADFAGWVNESFQAAGAIGVGENVHDVLDNIGLETNPSSTESEIWYVKNGPASVFEPDEIAMSYGADDTWNGEIGGLLTYNVSALMPTNIMRLALALSYDRLPSLDGAGEERVITGIEIYIGEVSGQIVAAVDDRKPSEYDADALELFKNSVANLKEKLPANYELEGPSDPED